MRETKCVLVFSILTQDALRGTQAMHLIEESNTDLRWRAAHVPSAARAYRAADRYGPQHRRRVPGGTGKATSGFQEGQQVGVELVLVRVREAVGCARIDFQGRVRDQLR